MIFVNWWVIMSYTRLIMYIYARVENSIEFCFVLFFFLSKSVDRWTKPVIIIIFFTVCIQNTTVTNSNFTPSLGKNQFFHYYYYLIVIVRVKKYTICVCTTRGREKKKWNKNITIFNKKNLKKPLLLKRISSERGLVA